MTATTDPAQATEGTSNAPLFVQVQYHIVQSKGLGTDRVEKLARLLEENGAVQHSPPSVHERISLDGLTHAISATIDFPDYESISDLHIAVVKPEWIEASIAKGRLANPRSYSPDPRHFFSGLVVCCADLPNGDKDAIIGGVLAMGGLHSGAVTKQITHIVALTMDAEKCQTAVTKNLSCKIVLPHWFDDCLKLGKRIDEGPYLLPSPEILRKRPEDGIPDAARPDLQGASSTLPGRLPTPAGSPSASRRQLSIFNGKRVMLSTDLEIRNHLRGTIEDLIANGGGTITGSVHKADIFVCQFREGMEYQIASRADKDVGNLTWLYYLINNNTWTSPFRRLLHYPIARDGLPGFKDFRISLSNYNGEARLYLENLAKAAGCEFTKTMKMDNTHLITAHTVSEKCDAAKEWNINMINHLWLEESYAKWQIQSLTNSRYTHFPPRTNLSEVVGQTPIDKQAVERNFFPNTPNADEEAAEIRPLKPVQRKEQNTVSIRVSNSSAVQPSSSVNGPEQSANSGVPTPRASKQDRRNSEGAALRTPATIRFIPDGKENETPSTSGSRGAKERAVAKLHDLAPDIALYEKEKKRVGGVTHGRRKSSEEKVQDSFRKRSLSREDESEDALDEEARDTKRVKKAKGPPAMRLLITGYKPWVGDLKRESEGKQRLREFGISLTQDPTSCTHLAAPRILRTKNFICALAHAPIIISTQFVDDCLAKNERLRPEGFMLKDEEGEERQGVPLLDVTERAKVNKGRLLRGYSVYCTENIKGGFETYKAIVEANGGKCLLYRARAGSISSSKTGAVDSTNEDETPEDSEFLYLLSGESADETKLWPKFRQMVQSISRIPRIVKADWVIELALSQKIHWDEIYELMT